MFNCNWSFFIGGLLVAAGWDPFTLVERGVAAAAQISGGVKPRWEKELPASLDVFGWCTWDAFYSTVSARGISEGLQSLLTGGTPPKLLIIDDGWQVGSATVALTLLGSMLGQEGWIVGIWNILNKNSLISFVCFEWVHMAHPQALRAIDSCV